MVLFNRQLDDNEDLYYSKGISLKVDVITPLEFELASCKVAV